MTRTAGLIGCLLVVFAAGCETAPMRPKGVELRFMPDTGAMTWLTKNPFDIHPRDELLSGGDIALPMDFKLNVAVRALSSLRVQIVCGTSLYSFAPKTREGTCVIPIPPEGDIAVTAKLFSETGIIEEKQFLIPRFPNALNW
jgi:hypothetical protein